MGEGCRGKTGRKAQEERQGHIRHLLGHGASGQEGAREGKLLPRAGLAQCCILRCRTATSQTLHSPLKGFAFGEGARWCQHKWHQVSSGAIQLQVSAAFLPVLSIPSLPVSLAALLEAIILCTNLILDLDELKKGHLISHHLPQIFSNLKEAARK